MTWIKTKRYIRIQFKTASGLLIGSSSSTNTDCDVLRNSKEEPYIPGSSIAGVLRDLLEEKGKEYVVKYFGDVEKNTGSGTASPAKESRLVFHDAVLQDEKAEVSIRDHVRLDQFKTAVEGAKFDTEMLEPDSVFVTYIEQNAAGGDPDVLDDISKLFAEDRVHFGAKTSRGFGRIKDVEIKTASFNMEDCEDIKNWLKFDLYKPEYWTAKTVSCEKDSRYALKLDLELIGGISIRQYTTDVSDNEDETLPDYRQLTAREIIETENQTHPGRKKEETRYVPVIPGSSWAGAIKHRISEFGENLSEYLYEDNKKTNTGDYFGRVSGNEKMKSQITFSESKIYGGTDKVISRNAIDRISGGTIDGALFTEKTHYGGNCTLEISFSKPVKNVYSDEFINAFAAALSDLHHGYLAVGGNTAIGRGIFRIIKVNGESVDHQQIYPLIHKKLADINDQFKGDVKQ